ncbi:hypothetical protein [Azospirillum argentinense]|uniref:hypothetical protein n=1 Tax=Azospirillum argentinense TaxID=2970906 RepID=UPI0032DF5CAC
MADQVYILGASGPDGRADLLRPLPLRPRATRRLADLGFLAVDLLVTGDGGDDVTATDYPLRRLLARLGRE